jgi:hypothetical protein
MLIVAAALLAGCRGKRPTSPIVQSGQPDREIKEFPFFTRDIQEIITRIGCSSVGCHGESQGNLTLGPDAMENYNQLVNVPAHEERGYLRVKPGDPDSSYVMVKLEGRQTFGSPMPPGAPLDSIDLTNIRNWIKHGAIWE